MRPRDYHRDLTSERLIKVAQLLARGRQHALERFDPDIGDGRWTLGVCAFEYGRFEVAGAAQSPGFEWLSTPDPRRRFIFQVGSIRMRFYRGRAASPNANMVVPTEMEQLYLFGAESHLDDVTFRIAVDTDEDGSILQISFVALRGGAPETVWAIPYETAAPLVLAVASEPPPAVELDAASFSFTDEDDDQADKDGVKGGSGTT